MYLSGQSSNEVDEDEEAFTEYILPHALAAVQQLCQTNSLLISIEEQIEARVFDKVPYAFEWGPGRLPGLSGPSSEDVNADGGDGDDGTGIKSIFGAPPIHPEVLNTPQFKRAYRRFTVGMRQVSRRFGFAFYWYFKEAAMAAWWALYLRSTAAEREVLRLPMGLVDPSKAVFMRVPLDLKRFGPHQKRLVVKHVDDPEGKIYHYGVFCDNDVYTTTPVSHWKRAVDATWNMARNNNTNRLLALHQEALSRGRDYSIIPASEFYDLCDQLAALQEIRTNHLMAEAISTAPYMVVQPENLSLANTSLEQAPPSQAFATHDILTERMNQALQLKRYTMAEFHAMMEQSEADDEALTGRPRGQPSIADLHRLQHGRPGPGDNMKKLPPDTRLVHMAKPTTIHDLDAEEQRLRVAIANAMKVPLAWLEGGAVSKGAAVGSETKSLNNTRKVESAEEMALDSTIDKERSFHERLFEHVYAVVFGPLDIQELDQVLIGLNARLATQRQARDYAKALARFIDTLAPPTAVRKSNGANSSGTEAGEDGDGDDPDAEEDDHQKKQKVWPLETHDENFFEARF